MNFFYMIASLGNILSIFPRFSMKFSTGILAPSHFVADDPFPLISYAILYLLYTKQVVTKCLGQIASYDGT